MILVLSYSYHEQGTEGVIDWLVYKKANFIKITYEDLYKNSEELKIDIVEEKIFQKGVDITDKINVVFYRRLFSQVDIENNGGVFKEQLARELTDEIYTLIHYLFSILKRKIWLPKPNVVNVNKLTMMKEASRAGLSVPKTIVCNNKNSLIEFFDSCNQSVITKPINKSGYFTVDNITYYANVNSLDKSFIDELPETFFPSLFQEKIQRKYEVRVFYLDGYFYNVAMMISGNDKVVDVKLASRANTSHWIPYKLPQDIENAIDKFMRSISLNTGSIDIVKSNDNRYFFLEVNPVGQYGAPSQFGNFELDKKIAEWLIKKDSFYGNGI